MKNPFAKALERYAPNGGEHQVKLNLFLLQCAGEDAAQEAIRREINRQIAAQGYAACVEECCFNLNLPLERASVVVNNKPVEWTDEAL